MEYPQAYDCNACKKTHQRKAIHLRLDGNGDVIVAPAIYEELKTVFMAGLEVVNEVASPPPLMIGAVDKDKERIVEQPLSGYMPAHKINPSETKYDGRARLEKPWLPILDALNLDLDKQRAAKQREKKKLYVVTKKGKKK